MRFANETLKPLPGQWPGTLNKRTFGSHQNREKNCSKHKVRFAMWKGRATRGFDERRKSR
jgi:hypothetical protein